MQASFSGIPLPAFLYRDSDCSRRQLSSIPPIRKRFSQGECFSAKRVFSAKRLIICGLYWIEPSGLNRANSKRASLMQILRKLPIPNDQQLLWWSALSTIALEALTCVLRFGVKLESTRDTASTVGRLTFGLRIRHSYIGALVLLVAITLLHRYPKWARYGVIIGAGLLLSDLIHHFLVLYPITGSPQFHLCYPQ